MGLTPSNPNKELPEEKTTSVASALSSPIVSFEGAPLNVVVIGFKGSGQTSLCASQARFDPELNQELERPDLLDYEEFLLYGAQIDGRATTTNFRLFDFDANWCHSGKWMPVMQERVKLRVDCIACVIDSTQFESVFKANPKYAARRWTYDLYPVWDVLSIIKKWSDRSVGIISDKEFANFDIDQLNQILSGGAGGTTQSFAGTPGGGNMSSMASGFGGFASTRAAHGSTVMFPTGMSDEVSPDALIDPRDSIDLTILKLVTAYVKSSRTVSQPRYLSDDVLSVSCDYRNPDGTQPSLLIWANFQDLASAAKKKEIIQDIGKKNLTDSFNIWTVQESSALTGHGLLEGLEFILDKRSKLVKPRPRSLIDGIRVAL